MLSYIRYDFNRVSKKKPSLTAILLLSIINAGFRAILLYRVGHVCRKRGYWIVAAITERIMHHACHCWISTAATIDRGFLIAHVGGIVIGSTVRIGANCDIRQNVTLGGNFSRQTEDGRTQPVLADNISLGADAVILGPVKIGFNTIIGANSVVTRDMPPNSIVSGIPATVIKARWAENDGRRL